MKTKFIQTRINEDVFLKLKEKAEDEERSLSSLIRIIVKNYLGNNKKENAIIEFKCKACGWKSYPGATIRQNKKGTTHYCPECDSILGAKIEAVEQAFVLKDKRGENGKNKNR